jgi:hypothetical protein
MADKKKTEWIQRVSPTDRDQAAFFSGVMAVAWAYRKGTPKRPLNWAQALEIARWAWSFRHTRMDRFVEHSLHDHNDWLEAWRRCPPCGVFYRGPGRKFCHQRWCPFCWGRRYAYPLFDRLRDAVVLWKEPRWVVGYIDELKYTANQSRRPSAVEEMFAISRLHREKIKRRLRQEAVGGYVLSSLAPAGGGWLARTRWVAVMNREQFLYWKAQAQTAEGTWGEWWPCRTQGNALAITRHICRFPSGLLTSKTEEALRFLQLPDLARAHLSEFYGILFPRQQPGPQLKVSRRSRQAFVLE